MIRRLMAHNCACSSQIPIQKHGTFLNIIAHKELRSKLSSVPMRKPPKVLRVKASINNKVYEDESEGIVCYQDDNGEIICEGYDEGPRFQRISRPKYHHPRDAEIMNLLQQSWLQIVKGEEINQAIQGVCLQQDFNI